MSSHAYQRDQTQQAQIMDRFDMLVQIGPRVEVTVTTRAVTVHRAELIVQNEVDAEREVGDTLFANIMSSGCAEVACKSLRILKVQIAT